MVDTFIGRDVKEKHKNKIYSSLLKGEKILGIFNFKKKHYLIITSYFVIIWNRGLGTHSYSRISHDSVNEVRLSDTQKDALSLLIDGKETQFLQLHTEEFSTLTEIINFVIKEGRTFIIGKGVDFNLVKKLNDEIIDDGESIVAVFKGRRGNDYLCLTGKRVILWIRGLISADIESILLEFIGSVEGNQGIKWGEVVFNVSGNIRKFGEMPRGDGKRAAGIIRKVLNNQQQSKSLTNQNLNSQIITPEAPLLIIQSRYAKGEITKKEFDSLIDDINNSNPKANFYCGACGAENASNSSYCVECGTMSK